MVNSSEFQLVKVIQKLEIFSNLDSEDARTIVRLCQRSSFAEGEVIWKPGDAGDSMFVLISGKLHVKNGADQVIGEVLPGASFGEMACLSGSPRFVGFQAVEPSTALCLTRRALRSLVNGNPKLYVHVLEMTIKVLAERITRGWAEQQSAGSVDSDALGRW